MGLQSNQRGRAAKSPATKWEMKYIFLPDISPILKIRGSIQAFKSFLSLCPAIISLWINSSLGIRQLENPRRVGNLMPPPRPRSQRRKSTELIPRTYKQKCPSGTRSRTIHVRSKGLGDASPTNKMDDSGCAKIVRFPHVCTTMHCLPVMRGAIGFDPTNTTAAL